MSLVIKRRRDGRIHTVETSDISLIWTNFVGAEGRFNAAGERNFNIVLTPEDAHILQAEGMNVKYHEPREEGDDGLYTLRVKVNYNSPHPPTITMRNNHGMADLTEDSVMVLDTAEIEEAFVRFRVNYYEGHVTPYLEKLLVRIYVSDFESKFYDPEESAMNTMTFRKVEAD